MIVLASQIRQRACCRFPELVAVAGVLRFVGVKWSPRPAVPTNIDADTDDCIDDDALERVSRFVFKGESIKASISAL